MSAGRVSAPEPPTARPSGGREAESGIAGGSLDRLSEKAHWLLPPLVIGLLMAPMILTSRAYASDWSNNLWLVWEQSLNIKTLGHPSYFLQSGLGAFFPQFLFYGGTLFSVMGFVAGIGGEHPLAVYVFTYLLALVGAYAGWLWLCTQLGLSGWRAHIPAILYLSSSYYVTNIYGRGDLGETVATSMLPLAVACLVRLVLARSWSLAQLALLIVAVVFLTGSHPLTLVWGATFLALLTLALAPVFWRDARVSRRRLAAVLGVAALGLGVNAWALVPTLAYHNRVFHAAETTMTQLWYSTPGVLFGIARDTVNPTWVTGDVQTQAPVLAIVWALIVGVACWRLAPSAVRRAIVGLTMLLALLVWLTLSPSVLDALPRPWNNLQFPFRLVIYVTITGCALVTCALLTLSRAPARRRRAAEMAVAVVAIISVALAVHQVWHAPSFFFKRRTEVFASAVALPRSYYSGLDFADSSAPVVQPTIGQLQGGTPSVPRPAIELPGSPLTATYRYPIVVSQPGTVATNVATGPYLVSVEGAVPVGRTESGLMVVRVSGTPGQHEILSFSTTSSRALKVGLIGTCISLLGIALLFVAVLVRRRRMQGRDHAA